jgi:hypothetical protein
MLVVGEHVWSSWPMSAPKISTNLPNVTLERGSEVSGRVASWPVAGDDARQMSHGRDEIPQRRGES